MWLWEVIATSTHYLELSQVSHFLESIILKWLVQFGRGVNSRQECSDSYLKHFNEV